MRDSTSGSGVCPILPVLSTDRLALVAIFRVDVRFTDVQFIWNDIGITLASGELDKPIVGL